MRRLVFLVAALGVLTVAVTAQAKGPIAGTIDGPGTGDGISLGSAVDLGRFAQEAGFFPALFRPTPDPMLDHRPKGDLGLRYTVTYRLPGPNGKQDEIRQDLYPYATDGPVLYTAPGQRFFETRTTRGGWYQASPTLKDRLVAVGLPATAPSDSASGDETSIGDFWLPATVAFALALAGLAALLARRRPRNATT
jgi:uncharacterized protein (TIGR03382 family)